MTNNHLKQEWKEEMSEKEALDLALATIVKTMDTVDPNPERLELVVVKRRDETETVSYRKVTTEEVIVLLAEKKTRDEAEAAKKEKK
jgi:20S proteasome alpha/beta subunit